MTFITPYWNMDSIIILTIALLTSVTIAYYYMTRKFKYWRERGVSEISPIPERKMRAATPAFWLLPFLRDCLKRPSHPFSKSELIVHPFSDAVGKACTCTKFLNTKIMGVARTRTKYMLYRPRQKLGVQLVPILKMGARGVSSSPVKTVTAKTPAWPLSSFSLPIPFLGNFAECVLMKKSLGLVLKEFYDQAEGEPCVGFFVFDKPFLLLRDHEVIKNVLVKDFDHFSDRYFILDENDRLGYANLFFIKNPVWKMLRMKMTPFFTPAKLKKMVNLMDQCATNLVDYLNTMNLKNEGKTVEVKELSAKFTVDVIGSTVFGLDTNSFKDPDTEFYKHGKMILEAARSFEVLAVIFMPTLCRLTGLTFFGKKTNAFLRKVLWETITQRIESGTTRNDLIDILIDLKRNHCDEDIKGFKFSGDDLLAQAAIFFLAGFETSSTTMSFALYELALNIEIQDRVRKEISQALVASDGKITYEMLMSLSYLEMVFLEVLRIYPPLEYLQRTTTEVYNMPNSDLVIEKDTPIFISVRGLHYDPKYFPNPDKFDPERFNQENKCTRPMYVHLPFGDGPHACIGTRMALLEMKLAFVKIFNNFEVTPCEKTLIPMKCNPTTILTTPSEGVIYLNMRKLYTNEKLQIA